MASWSANCIARSNRAWYASSHGAANVLCARSRRRRRRRRRGCRPRPRPPRSPLACAMREGTSDGTPASARAGEAWRVRRRPWLERRRRVRVDDVPRHPGALPRVVKPNPKLGQHVRVPALGVETHAERDPPDVAPRPQRVDEGEAAPGEARVHLGRGRDRDDGAVARLHAPAVLGDAAHRAEPTRRAP